MTETTVAKKMEDGSPRPGPFGAALVLAPLIVGLPCWGIVWLSTLNDSFAPLAFVAFLPAIALPLGLPSYLLFGGILFWRALERRQSVVVAGFFANIVSLPIVLFVFLIFPTGFGPLAVLGIYGILGSVFALLWSAVFDVLYNRFV